MDTTSHLIFAKILLEKAGLNPEMEKWGVSPDNDFKDGMIHRVSLHTLNRLEEIEKEGINQGFPGANKTEIALCVVSHLWLDMFNAPVWSFYSKKLTPSFRFRLWEYYFPKYGITSAIEEFKKDMERITFHTPSDFHEDSKEIFKKIPEDSDPVVLISLLIRDLWENTLHISDRSLKNTISYIKKSIGQDITVFPSDQLKILEPYGQLLKRYAEKI